MTRRGTPNSSVLYLEPIGFIRAGACNGMSFSEVADLIAAFLMRRDDGVANEST